ncbi:MAG: DedA family protein [Alphaproteobacteria bacterium]
MIEELRELYQSYGAVFYVITFFWALLEGETFLIFAGLLASQDVMRLEYLIPAAALGTTCGDFIFFMLGRRYGLKLIERSAKLKRGKDKISGWLEKHDVGFILTYRFIYGLRNVSAIVIGMSKIDWRRYFVLNFIASWVWAISFAGLGYLFGDMFDSMDPTIVITVGALLLIAIFTGLRFFHSRHKAKKGSDSTPD